MHAYGKSTVHYYGIFDLDEEGKSDSGVYDVEPTRRATRRKNI